MPQSNIWGLPHKAVKIKKEFFNQFLKYLDLLEPVAKLLLNLQQVQYLTEKKEKDLWKTPERGWSSVSSDM